jgi:hypothetical protein
MNQNVRYAAFHAHNVHKSSSITLYCSYSNSSLLSAFLEPNFCNIIALICHIKDDNNWITSDPSFVLVLSNIYLCPKWVSVVNRN